MDYCKGKTLRNLSIPPKPEGNQHVNKVRLLEILLVNFDDFECLNFISTNCVGGEIVVDFVYLIT